MTNDMFSSNESATLYFSELKLVYKNFHYYFSDGFLEQNIVSLANYFGLSLENCKDMLYDLYCGIGISNGSQFYGFSLHEKGQYALKKIQTPYFVEMYRIPHESIFINEKTNKKVYALFNNEPSELWSIAFDRTHFVKIDEMAVQLQVEESFLKTFFRKYNGTNEGFFNDKESCILALNQLSNYIQFEPKPKQLYVLPYFEFGEHFTLSHLSYMAGSDNEVIKTLDVKMDWYKQKIKNAGGTLVNNKVIFLNESDAKSCLISIYKDIH